MHRGYIILPLICLGDDCRLALEDNQPHPPLEAEGNSNHTVMADPQAYQLDITAWQQEQQGMGKLLATEPKKEDLSAKATQVPSTGSRRLKGSCTSNASCPAGWICSSAGKCKQPDSLPTDDA
jgi:hypothetical protein